MVQQLQVPSQVVQLVSCLCFSPRDPRSVVFTLVSRTCVDEQNKCYSEDNVFAHRHPDRQDRMAHSRRDDTCLSSYQSRDATHEEQQESQSVPFALGDLPLTLPCKSAVNLAVDNSSLTQLLRQTSEQSIQIKWTYNRRQAKPSVARLVTLFFCWGFAAFVAKMKNWSTRVLVSAS